MYCILPVYKIKILQTQKVEMSGPGNHLQQDLIMSIKQQQAIEQILKETMEMQINNSSKLMGKITNMIPIRERNITQQIKVSSQLLTKNEIQPQFRNSFQAPNRNSFSYYEEVHKDINTLLKQSQAEISKQYQKIRREQFRRNRTAIEVGDEDDQLKQIFSRMDLDKDRKSQVSSVVSANQRDKNQKDKQIKHKDKNSLNEQSDLDSVKSKSRRGSVMLSQNGLQEEKIQGFANAFDLDLNRLRHDSLKQPRKRTYSSILNQKKSNQQAQQYSDSSFESIQQKHELVNPTPISFKVPASSHPLCQFEQTQIVKQQQRTQKIQQLDQKYPKVNPSSMYKHAFPIFKFQTSSIDKFIKFQKIGIQDIACALVFWIGQQKWILLAIKDILYLFVTDTWSQPIIINPQKNPSNPATYLPIRFLSVSPSLNHVTVSLGTQIIIYSIKKEIKSFVLYKNLSGTNELAGLFNVTKLCMFGPKDKDNPVQFIYLDKGKEGKQHKGSAIGIVRCQQIVFMNRVTEKFIQHGLGDVEDIDILNRGGKSSVYLAIASRKKLKVFKIQPTIQLIHTSTLHQQRVQCLSLRWRFQPPQQGNSQKPQLLISYNTKVYLYKLIESEQVVAPSAKTGFFSNNNQNSSSQAHLQLHLHYRNHYNIITMEVISNTHLLLYSKENIIVVAIPLITSCDLSQEIMREKMDKEGKNPNQIEDVESDQGLPRMRKQSTQHEQVFQSSIVFITSQPSPVLLYPSPTQILFFSSKTQSLQTATLIPLQMYLDNLLITHSNFREAFALLILIHKGINYSFKFSYTPAALSQCIFSAIECTVSSFILGIGENIVQYRLAWLCQMLVQTRNQSMIWGHLWKKLGDKEKQRVKQLNSHQMIQQIQIKPNRQSYYEELVHFSQNQQNKLKKSLSRQLPLPSSSNNQATPSHSYGLQHRQSLPTPPPKSEGPYIPLPRILFSILEPLILKAHISSIPQQIFFAIIKYECQKKEDLIIQKIILQNKMDYDGSLLMGLLQNQQRDYLQIYLFARGIVCGEVDYYTGLVKVIANYKKYKIMIENQLSTTNKSISANSLNIQNLPLSVMQQRLSFTATLCLWYLSKCLKFQRVPAGQMPLNEKQAIVSSFCLPIMHTTVTQKLMTFNCKIFLQVYLLMFIGEEIAGFITQENQQLVAGYKKMFPTQYQDIMSMANYKDGQVFDKSFKQLAILHLQRTLPTLKKSQKLLWSQFLSLSSYYNPNEIPLSFETSYDILLTFLEHKPVVFTLTPPLSSPYTPTANIHLSKPFPSIASMELFLIEQIKPVLQEKKDRFYINKLISYGDRNVAFQLYRIDRQFGKAIQWFLANIMQNIKKNKVNEKRSRKLKKIVSQQQQAENSKMIQFIYQILQDVKQIPDKLTRDKKTQDIKQVLIKNISNLFTIDKFQALNIFYEIGETSQSIYNLTDQTLTNKLLFLSAVLKKFQHQDFYLKEKFQLEHLAQVCQLQSKKQMMEYLSQFEYPLDQAIIVCEQKGNLLAKAIFQERCGRIGDAYISYQRILRGIIQGNANAGKSERKIKKDVHKYTQQCLRLCKMCPYDPNSSQQDNFWLKIITFINGFIKSNSQHKIFLKVQFERVLQHILLQMFNFLPTTLLIDFFIEKHHRLQLSMSKQFSIFQNLFILIKFDKTILIKSLEINKIDIKDTRKQAMIKRKQGLIGSALCGFCRKIIYEGTQKCYVYACGHCYHGVCCENGSSGGSGYRCLSCYLQSQDAVFQGNIINLQVSKMTDIEQLGFVSPAKSNKSKNTTQSGNQNGNYLKPQNLNLNIIVQSKSQARNESSKKKLKLYDYNYEQYNSNFYSMVGGYDSKKEQENKQKQKQNQPKQHELSKEMDEFENQYVKYTKDGGLEVKKRDAMDIGEDYGIWKNQYRQKQKQKEEAEQLNKKIGSQQN